MGTPIPWYRLRISGSTTRRLAGGGTTKTYPFSQLTFTENVTTLNEDNMAQWGVDCYRARGVELLLSRDGTRTDQILSIPFRVVSQSQYFMPDMGTASSPSGQSGKNVPG